MLRRIYTAPKSAPVGPPAAALLLAATLLVPALLTPAAVLAAGQDDDGRSIRFGIEAKAHYRSSEKKESFRVNFPTVRELRPVDPGEHVEISTVTLFVDAQWGESVTAHAKIDIIDLYDRNPTSTHDEIDIDEAWIRFGQETPPALLPESRGQYVKVGKMPKFERQNDRHLESYGLVSTAFNRMEDVGIEVGVDLGRHIYLKGSLTAGNPIFLRDVNALAGDHGTPELLEGLPPRLFSGTPIYYDADVESLDTDGDLEVGWGLGARWSSVDGRYGVDFLAWGYARDLADTVPIDGSFYGGDLDILQGPRNAFPFPIEPGNRDKEEIGANLWLYLGELSVFAQYVDQDVAGLERTGLEVELAYRVELPLVWAIGGEQLFTYIAPAVRYSELDPDFSPPPVTPSPSFGWAWEKIDGGLRLGVLEGIDVTAEYTWNEFITAGGPRENNELLVTLRWRR